MEKEKEKKAYIEPQALVVVFQRQDIIVTSGQTPEYDNSFNPC